MRDAGSRLGAAAGPVCDRPGVAFPSLAVSVVCALNVGLFVHMAIDDERVLLGSAIAADYRAYRGRVGMF